MRRTNRSRATVGRLIVIVVTVVVLSSTVTTAATVRGPTAADLTTVTATDAAPAAEEHPTEARSVTTVGATAAPHERAQTATGTPSDDAAVTIQDGETYYVGQTLKRSRGVPADDRLELRRSGRLVAAVFSTSQGVARMDTSGRAAGQYSLRAPNDTEVVTFRLVEQTVDVSFTSSTVSNRGNGTATTLDLSTNRPSPVYYVTATVDGEQLDSTALQRLFGGRGTTVRADVLRITGTGTTESFSLNASGVDEGTLTLTATPPDAEATDSATITVEAPGPTSATFAPRVVQSTTGDVVTIGVAFDHTDRATLTVGSAPMNYRVTMTVVDGDGDGEATVRWDTSRAGQGDPNDAFESGDPADSVRNVSRSTGGLTGSLADGQYPMSLVVDGTERDVGTVSLREATTPTVCGRAGETLVDRYHDNLDSVPTLAEGMITDETIHLIVNGDTGGQYTVVTGTDTRVATFRRGEPDDSTVEVETDCETVRTVLDAQSPADAFTTEYDNGEISVRGTTFVKSIVITASKLLFDIGRTLGLF